MAPPMASDEVNLLVYTYLAEHQFTHSAYALFNEATPKRVGLRAGVQKPDGSGDFHILKHPPGHCA